MKTIKTNKDKLVVQSVIGEVHSPEVAAPYKVSHAGAPMVLPGTGGITYNVQVGHSVYAHVGDHIEPGVSVYNPKAAESAALNTLACIGNRARVLGGDAKGELGWVTGKHGGVEHVLVHFAPEVLERLAIGDKIQIMAAGQGLALDGMAGITLMNLDPTLFEKMGVWQQAGVLHVPVAAKVPAHLMGSGLGASHAYKGDYDIMTADAAELAKNGLDKLRYGDVVLLENCDNSFGRGYLAGAATIGVVVHGNSILMGHGPGVVPVITAKTPIIRGEPDYGANIANHLGL